jgi:hypothetical protein
MLACTPTPAVNAKESGRSVKLNERIVISVNKSKNPPIRTQHRIVHLKYKEIISSAKYRIWRITPPPERRTGIADGTYG